MVKRRAKDCGGLLAAGAYIFSRDVEGLEPWRPDSGVTGRFAALRSSVGLPHVRLHDLRHYMATRLLRNPPVAKSQTAPGVADPGKPELRHARLGM